MSRAQALADTRELRGLDFWGIVKRLEARAVADVLNNNTEPLDASACALITSITSPRLRFAEVASYCTARDKAFPGELTVGDIVDAARDYARGYISAFKRHGDSIVYGDCDISATAVEHLLELGYPPDAVRDAARSAGRE
jgi:hypothetical protein